MEEGEIILKGQEFNKWMGSMGEKITEAKDRLHLLKEEAEQISGVWESGAKEAWQRELHGILAQAERSLADLEDLAGLAGKKAEELARMEKIMTKAAQAL